MYNPLSESVAYAKIKHQKMQNYDLDVVDKTLHNSIMGKRQGIKSDLFSYLVESKVNELKAPGRTRKDK